MTPETPALKSPQPRARLAVAGAWRQDGASRCGLRSPAGFGDRGATPLAAGVNGLLRASQEVSEAMTIEAVLTDDDVIEGGGIKLKSRTPIFTLARKLVEAGRAPEGSRTRIDPPW